MEKPPLRAVMIGAGFFAAFQAEAWNRIDAVDLVAVADTLPGRAAAFAAQFGIKRSYTDAAQMLQAEKPDLADIITRPDSHLALTEMAAQHCRTVICQKPMARTWAECNAMVEQCAVLGARLLIHENWRWQPWYRETKRLLLQGRFGQPFHLGFRMRTGDGRGPEPYSSQPYFRDMDRLLLYETAVHFLDTFRFIAGDLQSVFCRTDRINPLIRGEDCAMVHLAFTSGAQGLIDANRISGDNPPEVAFGEFRLEGDTAMIRIAPNGSIFIRDYSQDEILHPVELSRRGYKGDSVMALQQHFIHCILTGEASESEGRDYLKTVAAVDACYRSAESGMVVKLT